MIIGMGQINLLMQLFSRSAENRSRSYNLLGHFILTIMIPSLIVADAKHCTLFSEIDGFGKSSLSLMK